jgi:hypothetical protein
MSKLNELFVNNINKAITAADVMSDINAKPMAYASIAHALAVYLQGNTSVINLPQEHEAVNATGIDLGTPEKVGESTLNEGIEQLQANNQKVAAAIDNAIAGDQWTLPYDQHGIPYLNDEDFAIPERVLAYNNAMTPELEAKKQEIANAQGQAIMNEAPVAPVAEAPQATAPAPAPQATAPVAEYKQEHLDQLEAYKVSFDYANNPAQLDTLYHNFTDGTSATLAEINPSTIEAFLYFIQDELAKARVRLQEWENSWLTKEGLNNLIAEAYQTPGATIDTYVSDGNIFWFLDCVELYNANAWLNSYKAEMSADQLNGYVRQYFDNATLTIDNIDDTNVVGLIYFIQQSMAQTA